MCGKILGHHRAQFHLDTWLKTDDIQFFVSFLMRNKLSNNRFVHVLYPTIIRRAMYVYSLMGIMWQNDNNATQIQSKVYHTNLEAIPDYIDSKLDLFQNNLLVFLLTWNNVHWIYIVIINLFLVHDRYLCSVGDTTHHSP
jgi:hypothetical protein